MGRLEISIVKFSRVLFYAGLVSVVLVLTLLAQGIARAQTPQPTVTPPPLQISKPPSPGVDNSYCLGCHAKPDLYMTLPSGEQLYLTIDNAEYHASVHGKDGYACVQCHTTIASFPHPQLNVQTRRDLSLLLYQSCARCHLDKYEKTLDSTHEKALLAGNKDAAICTDCHGAHNVQKPDEPRSRTAQMCERCHSKIYNDYQNSVHGKALIGEGNPDVPTCIDCHGVHNVQGPNTGPFLLYSPEICAKCHANKDLMAKYNISTDVFNTYIADFHGTTVIFDQKVPGQQTNKPVCVDCHGVHNILPPNDPNSTVMKSNLLTTCQRCHPDAGANFPTAWLGHYTPSPQKFPLVYFVDLFYKIFIPVVLGGMVLFVLGDAGRRIYNLIKGRSHAG